MMKRKLVMCLLMIVVAMQASAQSESGRVSFVPQVGGTYSNINLHTCKASFAAGVGADWQLTDKFFLSSGVFYNSLAYGIGEGHNDSYSVGRVGVPVMAGYYLFGGLAVKAGLEADFKVNEGDKAEMQSTVVSVPVGLSYEVSNVVFNARYNIGLTTEETAKYYVTPIKHNFNGWFTLAVGYRF